MLSGLLRRHYGRSHLGLCGRAYEATSLHAIHISLDHSVLRPSLPMDLLYTRFVSVVFYPHQKAKTAHSFQLRQKRASTENSD